MKSVFKAVSPYEEDEMNLPVENVDESVPFYESVMGFKVLSRSDSPHKSATLGRDEIKIRLAENGGDPTQEGCFFEVDNAEAAFAELKANGLKRSSVKSSPRSRSTAYSKFRYQYPFASSSASS